MDAKKMIDKEIAELKDWRGDVMADVRKIVLAANKDIVEDWKWNTPVWAYKKKNLCAVGAFKDHVKINFFFGASLPDPKKLFNSGLEAKTSRSIDIRKGDKLDKAGITALIKSAAAQIDA